MECGLLLREMVLCLARVEESRWSSVFSFCFWLPPTTGVSTTSSMSFRCNRHRLTAGAVSHHELSSTISANARCSLWDAKPFLHNRRVFTNPQRCATVPGQSIHQLCRICFVSLYGHGHVYDRDIDSDGPPQWRFVAMARLPPTQSID